MLSERLNSGAVEILHSFGHAWAENNKKGCDHYTNGDAMKRIFKRYPTVAGHNVQYKYTRYGGYACGRRYARSTLPPDQRFDPLQGMKREVRNVAAKPGVVDLDIVACHPNMLLDILGAERASALCPAVVEYVDGRAAKLAEVSKLYGVDRDAAKLLFNMPICDYEPKPGEVDQYCGSLVNRWRKEAGAHKRTAATAKFEEDFAAGFLAGLRAARSALLVQFPTFRDAAKSKLDGLPADDPKRRRYNETGSAISLLLGSAEDVAIEAVRERLQDNDVLDGCEMTAIVFDGGLVDGLQGVEARVRERLRADIVQHVRARFGWRHFDLAFKPLGEPWADSAGMTHSEATAKVLAASAAALRERFVLSQLGASMQVVQLDTINEMGYLEPLYWAPAKFVENFQPKHGHIKTWEYEKVDEPADGEPGSRPTGKVVKMAAALRVRGDPPAPKRLEYFLSCQHPEGFQCSGPWFDASLPPMQPVSVQCGGGGGRVVTQTRFNEWHGFGVEAVKGDWSKIEHLMRDVLCNGDQAAYEFLVRDCAAMVQRPTGERSGIVHVFRGGAGIGKTTFSSDVLGRIFGNGRHYLHLNSVERATGEFNGQLDGKVVVCFDEAVFAGDPRMTNILKSMRVLLTGR